MARTVDTSSTLENFRVEHNNLATDIGAIGNLRTGDTSSIVNAVNYIMDQYFFFQDFDFDGSDGATSNTVFSGDDNLGNTLQYAAGKVLVYKNGLLLRNGTDYTASNNTSITLASGASNSDVIRITSYTGSYQNVAAAESTFDAWQSAGSVIYNQNEGGIVFNADDSITTTPTVANSFQFDGPSYHNDAITVGVNDTGHDVKFFGATSGKYLLWDQSADALLLTDSTSIKIGNSQDLQLSHDGSNSIIKDVGTGNLLLQSDGGGVNIMKGSSYTLAEFKTDAEVALYYNNVKKFETQSTGINVVGNVSVGGSNNELRFYEGSNYVGFEAPALSANNIWVLPAADGSDGQYLKTDGSGGLTFGTVSSTAPDFNVSAQNSENSTHFPVFVDGATGSQAAETDTGLTYNPSTGMLTSTGFTGAVTGNASSATVLAANKNFSLTGDVTATAVAFNGSDVVTLNTNIASNVVGALELNVSGNGNSGQILASDGDGTFSWTSDGGLTTEAVEDIVGAMFTGNTETGISVTYQDSTADIDLVIGTDAIVSAMIADNAITSENYTDGSIQSEHIADDAIHAGKMAISNGNGSSGQILASDGDATFTWVTDAGLSAEEVQDIVGAMVSSNTETGISVTYVDDDNNLDFVIGDNAIVQSMIADNAIDSQMYVDASIDTIHIADFQVTLAKMADIGRGRLIVGESSGRPSVLAPGSNGQVLKSNGTDISWGTDNNDNDNTTYGQEWVDSGANAILRLNPNTGDNDDLTIVAGSNISLTPSGDNLTVAFTNASGFTDNAGTITSVGTGGSGLSSSVSSGAVTVSWNAVGITTSTSDADGDFFVVHSGATDSGSTKKLTKGNINLSGFNNDSGFTTNSGDITAVVAGTALTGGATSGSATINLGADVRGHPNARFGNNNTDFILFDSDNDLLRFYVNDSEMAQIDSSGNLDVENDVIAFSTAVSSDERLKKNIKRIESPLDTVMKLEGVTFDWKKDDRNSMGLIAQEVEKHLPYLVTESKSLNSDEMSKKLNYNGLIGLLLESIKELKSELDDLKSSNS